MRKLALISPAMLLWVSTEANAFDILKPREVAVDLYGFFPGGRDPRITSNGLPGRFLGYQLNLDIKTDVLTYLYWDSIIHSMTDRGTNDPGQFRLVGLEMRLGVRILPELEVGFYHFSQHLLDASFPWQFPVQDALQVKFNIFLDKKDRKSLF